MSLQRLVTDLLDVIVAGQLMTAILDMDESQRSQPLESSESTVMFRAPCDCYLRRYLFLCRHSSAIS
jgi:hypothetical protein